MLTSLKRYLTARREARYERLWQQMQRSPGLTFEGAQELRRVASRYGVWAARVRLAVWDALIDAQDDTPDGQSLARLRGSNAVDLVDEFREGLRTRQMVERGVLVSLACVLALVCWLVGVRPF